MSEVVVLSAGWQSVSANIVAPSGNGVAPASASRRAGPLTKARARIETRNRFGNNQLIGAANVESAPKTWTVVRLSSSHPNHRHPRLSTPGGISTPRGSRGRPAAYGWLWMGVDPQARPCASNARGVGYRPAGRSPR